MYGISSGAGVAKKIIKSKKCVRYVGLHDVFAATA
jgi:hypothetical protein